MPKAIRTGSIPEWEQGFEKILAYSSIRANEYEELKDFVRLWIEKTAVENYMNGLKRAVEMGELSLKTIEEIKKEIKKSGN